MAGLVRVFLPTLSFHSEKRASLFLPRLIELCTLAFNTHAHNEVIDCKFRIQMQNKDAVKKTLDTHNVTARAFNKRVTSLPSSLPAPRRVIESSWRREAASLAADLIHLAAASKEKNRVVKWGKVKCFTRHRNNDPFPQPFDGPRRVHLSPLRTRLRARPVSHPAAALCRLLHSLPNKRHLYLEALS